MQRALVVFVLSIVTVAGCARERAQTTGEPQAAGDLQIAFRTNPDPPATGENTFEVEVKGADGTPVTDAAVTMELFMPAMPSMKMPEMRSHTSLVHEGGGTYRGRGQVMMAGAWDVSVTVARGGQTLGSRRLSVTAK